MSTGTAVDRAALEAGATLPADWYTDASHHERELAAIFAHAWQYVGRAEEVSEPGSFFAAFAGHVPIVVVRDREGALRGFVNVCRHRAHLVVQGSGRRATLQCPYHAWTYGLDGSLQRAPRSEREPGFDPDGLSLLPVAVDVLGPLLFANPDSQAPPLAEALDPIPERLPAGGLDLDALRFRSRREWTVAADWKVVMENYLECYHCPVAHPSFSDLIDVDVDSYRLEADGRVLSQYGTPRPVGVAGNGAPYDVRGPVGEAQFHLLWPATTFNTEPGPPNLNMDVTRPEGPGRSVGFTDYFFGEEVPAETQEGLMAFSAQVGAEDFALVESVQRGLESAMVPRGRLLLESEQLLHRFQLLVCEAHERA